jgi:hypothetical protein
MNTQELKLMFQNLPQIKESITPESWDAKRRALRYHMLIEDPEDFLSWSTVQASLFTGAHSPDVSGKLSLIEHYPTLQKKCIAPPFGMLDRHEPYMSGTFVNQAYYLHLWEVTTGKRICNTDGIVEFGGGYGAMALMAHRFGFDESYWIYDFPELCLLQKYYLSNIGEESGIEHITWYSNAVKRWSVDLLIGICSFSETPLAERDLFFNNTPARSYLIVYQPNFDNYENKMYFENFMKEKKHLQWEHWHLGHGTKHWVAIGW